METVEDCIYSPYGRIGGILACLYLFATALYGAIFIYFPLLPLVLISPWHFRRAVEIMGSTYQTILVVCIFEKLCCDCRYTQYLNCKILHGEGGTLLQPLPNFSGNYVISSPQLHENKKKVFAIWDYIRPEFLKFIRAGWLFFV